MKYRARLLVAFLITVVLINGVTLGIMYYVASRSLFEEIGNNALSVAATTAAFVDGDAHRKIQNPEDEKKEEYARIKGVLKKARDANRRHDTKVEYLYTMMPMVGEPTARAYGVDAEEGRRRSMVNKEIIVTRGRLAALAEYHADREDFSGDEQGVWLSAAAPVKDSAGNVVAAVGVDLPAEFVQPKINRLRLAGLLSFGIAAALGSAFAFAYSARASRPVKSLCRTVEAVGRGEFDARMENGRKDEFGLIARGVNSMADGLRQNEAVKSAFACYVSQQVLDRVLETGALPTVQTERRRITVLFSDIREFTASSEYMRPEEVVTILNEYFEKMVEVVVRHKGTVDKFIGDGLMAFFGVPDEDSFQEENAVAAALEMQHELRKLNDKWSAEGRKPVRIGIGINSGNAIVGNIGSAQRLEYTAIGDTVNLAARLESTTKEFDVDVLISEYTYHGLKGAPVKIERMGAASVKGRADSVVVYAIAPLAAEETATRPEAAS